MLQEDPVSLEDKLNLLAEKCSETETFLNRLNSLKQKLEKKKETIKSIIEKKIEDNLKEVNRWRNSLNTVVDECIDEKIRKLSSQEEFLRTTQAEMKKVLDSARNSKVEDEEEEEEEGEDPKLDDLLALELRLQTDSILSQNETVEMDSSVKRDFTGLLAEPKKSLRRTFSYVAGIVRGYLRRGKSSFDWIKTMRKLEGREFEECIFKDEQIPKYIGTKLPIEEAPVTVSTMPSSQGWQTICKIYENRHNVKERDLFCSQLTSIYANDPEDIEFYLPQLCNILLHNFGFTSLKGFILSQCQQSFHFALKTYLLIRALKDSRNPPQKKKLAPKSLMNWRTMCDQLLKEIKGVVVLSKQQDVEIDSEERFMFSVSFLDRLVSISKNLVTVPPEKYNTFMKEELEKIQDQILVQNWEGGRDSTDLSAALAYIPTLRTLGSKEILKIVRIPVEEAFPIPTYARVLCYVWLEVIDLAPQVTSSSTSEVKQNKEEGNGEGGGGGRRGRYEVDSNPQSFKIETQVKTKIQKSIFWESEKTFDELKEEKEKRIRKISPLGSLPRWRIQPILVKYGDAVLQEEFCIQLIVQFQRIFTHCGTPVTLCPYRILPVSPQAGIIEPIVNSLSLDRLKKNHTNLLNFFIHTFGQPSEPSFKQAQLNFIKTMAGYSVVCYLLQLKDRHDGNLLLDSEGHIIHIDYGYLLGHTISFEKAPFKLTPDFIEVMGGYNSPCYKQYCRLCVKAFLAARKHYQEILALIEITGEGKGRKVIPCLKDGPKVLSDLKDRFHLQLSDTECKEFVLKLIEEARGSWRSIVYNAYQLILNNIH